MTAKRSTDSRSAETASRTLRSKAAGNSRSWAITFIPLQEYRGARAFHRCSWSAPMKSSFSAPMFWISGLMAGNLLTLESNGNYRWYHAVTQKFFGAYTSESALRSGAGQRGNSLSSGWDAEKTSLFGTGRLVLAEDIQSFISGPTMLALLKEDGSVWLCQPDGNRTDPAWVI